MHSWKDVLAAALGLTCLLAGHVYLFAFARPEGAPVNGVFVPDQGVKASWLKYKADHPELYKNIRAD